MRETPDSRCGLRRAPWPGATARPSPATQPHVPADSRPGGLPLRAALCSYPQGGWGEGQGLEMLKNLFFFCAGSLNVDQNLYATSTVFLGVFQDSEWGMWWSRTVTDGSRLRPVKNGHLPGQWKSRGRQAGMGGLVQSCGEPPASSYLPKKP